MKIKTKSDLHDAIHEFGYTSNSQTYYLGDAIWPDIAERDARIAELEAAVDREIEDSSTQSDRLLAVIDACEKRIAELEARLQLADALRNRERGLPPDVITVQAQARIADWEGSQGIVTVHERNTDVFGSNDMLLKRTERTYVPSST